MNKLIVAVFENEAKAFEGLTAIKELNSNGDLSLYATAVINKNEAGEIALKDAADQGPIGTAVAGLSGAFIGLLAGPAGMAVGAMAGAMGGMFYDINTTGIDATFVETVSIGLQEGKTAVVAEIDETWNAPLDTRMDELGAILFRKNKAEAEYDEYIRENEALNAELDELNEELKEAKEDAKESIQNQIDKVKAKQAALKESVDKKMSHLKEETDAKVAKLNEQISEAKDKSKAKLEKRKAKLEEKYEASKEKLSHLKEKLHK